MSAPVNQHDPRGETFYDLRADVPVIVTAAGRQRLATIIVKRPQCHACGAPLLVYANKGDQGDGSILTYRRCTNPKCGKRWRVCEE